MNKRFGFGLLALLLIPLLAHATCDTVKADIDAKIKASGVADYTLEVVAAGQTPASGKVVGDCEGDKQIVYTRGAGGTSSPADQPPSTAMPMNGGSDMPSEPTQASSSGQ